ncbi:MAG TPA: NAD(P)/FAD-dependent oxidoreductase, partial [Bacillota bacterium]|nr:NAD(P)/FAD-dependent oxidoreductase [Bacillota bacterium]
MSKKIIIIGAGIAGLSAGCHARRNGYEVEIFEKENRPGGLCTAWERNGYTFDGCIHWLVGTGPGSQFNRLWREVGALQGSEIYDHEVFLRLEGEQGRCVNIYSDLERLKNHLLELSPEDAPVIEEITGAALAFSRVKFPLEKARELYRPWDLPRLMVRMLPLFQYMGKLSRVSVAAYLKNFKDPFLREALGQLMPGGYAMTGLVSTLASLHSRDAGFPRGGSLEFARSIEQYYLALGGQIRYRAGVKRILVEGGRAAGIILEDGTREYGDIIISAADLHHTLYTLLKGKYLTPPIKQAFRLDTYTSVQVSLGVAADLAAEPHRLALRLKEPWVVGGEANRYLLINNYAFDPTLNPPGKTALAATLYSGYEEWSKLAQDQSRYREEKEKIAARVVELVEQRFPAARGRVETV